MRITVFCFFVGLVLTSSLNAQRLPLNKEAVNAHITTLEAQAEARNQEATQLQGQIAAIDLQLREEERRSHAEPTSTSSGHNEPKTGPAMTERYNTLSMQKRQVTDRIRAAKREALGIQNTIQTLKNYDKLYSRLSQIQTQVRNETGGSIENFPQARPIISDLESIDRYIREHNLHQR